MATIRRYPQPQPTDDPTRMTRAYRQHSLPPRARYTLAFGVGLMFACLLARGGAPFCLLLAPGVFLGVVAWLAFRRPSWGMEITAADWRFFVGRRHWRVPLADIASVRVLCWEDRPPSVAVTFLNGRTDVLPDELAPDIDALTEELLRRGVRVVA